MIIARIPKRCSKVNCPHNLKTWCNADIPVDKRPHKEIAPVEPIDFSKIAFVGQMGAGKDYVAKLLRGHFRVAFGDPIRLICNCIRNKDYMFALSISKSLFPSNWFKNIESHLDTIIANAKKIIKTVKDREILQYLGTEYRKTKGDVWITYGILKTLTEKKVVVTDCRRRNELDALREAGFILIYVYADYGTRRNRIMTRDHITENEFIKLSNHEAESEIVGLGDLCDFVINNSQYSESVQYQLSNILNGKVSKRG